MKLRAIVGGTKLKQKFRKKRHEVNFAKESGLIMFEVTTQPSKQQHINGF